MARGGRVRRWAALGALLVAGAGVLGEDPTPSTPTPRRSARGAAGELGGGGGAPLAPPARGSRLTRPGGAAPQGRSRTIAFTTTG